MKLVAAAYDIRFDAWVQVDQKKIRNPQHPAIVWMSQETWEALATHADMHTGEFYIPCRVGLTEPEQLRTVVRELEDGCP